MKFTVDKPLKGHDEDAPSFADDKLIVVCDGLGGGGQNAYLIDGEKRTSAYLGSRVISGACIEFVENNYDRFVADMQEPSALMAEMKAYISGVLDRYVAEKELKNIVKGKSMQMLPSTLAAVVYKHYEDHTDALVISAGDSRAFVLTPDEGLRQISKDDVFDDVDAFCKSATMTNNIRQDGEYHINYAYYSLPAKCVLLVCTDGCFDYISSPMELEFRLEYAISKCGDLFEEGKDNFGEYFGNVLVSSGLKDDCTMAGVFLGYEDSVHTKELFLQRALFVQNKYRNPYAEYDKKSLERQSEVAPLIPETEKRLAELNKELNAQLKTAVILAYKEDISGTLNLKIDNVFVSRESMDLMDKMADFELYKGFLSSLEEEERNAQELRSQKTDEYQSTRDNLLRIFKLMHFDAYINGLLRNNRVITMKNSEESVLAGDYKRLQNDLTQLEGIYSAALNAFSTAFEEFKAIDHREFVSSDLIIGLNFKYSELTKVFANYIGCKQDHGKCIERLKSCYMAKNENADAEFRNAWKQEFTPFASHPQYKELRSGYTKCITLQEEINSISPSLTNEQKIMKFSEHIDANWQEYMSMIKSDIPLCCSICGDLQDQIAECEIRLVELKESFGEYDNMKYALWAEYKPVYELYNHSTGGRV